MLDSDTRCALCSTPAERLITLRICPRCARDLAGDLPASTLTTPSTPAPRPRPLLTLKEAAALLRCSPRTVRRFIVEGRLCALDLAASSSPNGRRWRIRYRDLKRLQSDLTYDARTG